MTLREQQRLYRKASKAIREYQFHPEINDIEFGVKFINGKITDELCIRFNLYKKVHANYLSQQQIFPAEIAGFKTDIVDINTKPQVGWNEPQNKIRPIVGGIQILSEVFASDPYSVGTIGCGLNIQESIMGITNYHVLFGKIDSETAMKYYAGKSLIFQNTKDSFSDNCIGTASTIFDNTLDYALIHLTSKINKIQSFNGFVGHLDDLSVTKPIYGQTKVKKTGAKTGITYGIVTGRSLTNPAKISIVLDEELQGKDSSISLGGDSGSIWLVNDNSNKLKIVALHSEGDGEKNASAISFDYILSSITNKIKSI